MIVAVSTLQLYSAVMVIGGLAGIAFVLGVRGV